MDRYGEKSFSDMTAVAIEATKELVGIEPIGRVYTVRVKPTLPTNKRSSVSGVSTFTLPPRYPFVRPKFKIVKLKGRFVDAVDSILLGTAMNFVLNARCVHEPLSNSDAVPCLMDVLDEAQNYLTTYAAFLEDRAFQAAVKEEQEAKKRAELQARMDHAALLAYSTPFEPILRE
jgi:hypothetical protein